MAHDNAYSSSGSIILTIHIYFTDWLIDELTCLYLCRLYSNLCVIYLQKKAETPPENRSADAQITSAAVMNTQHVPPYAIERHTPRGPYPPGHDPTPALRTLSEYARPHALSTYPAFPFGVHYKFMNATF